MSSQNSVWSSDTDGRAYTPIYTQASKQARNHISNQARMNGEAFRNVFSSTQDQSVPLVI